MEVGAALLRIIGDQASHADVYDVLNEVIRNKALRERASSLSALSNELPVGRRQEHCRAMVLILLSKIDLPEEALPPVEFRPTSNAFATFIGFVAQNSAWRDHVTVTGAGERTAKKIRVSAYLREIVKTLEDLWDVKGHLLDKRPSLPQKRR